MLSFLGTAQKNKLAFCAVESSLRGADRVVLSRQGYVSLDADLSKICIGDFDPLGVLVGVEKGGHLQTGLGCVPTNIVQHSLNARQRLAGPFHRDEAEQPVFDGVPFWGPWGTERLKFAGHSADSSGNKAGTSRGEGDNLCFRPGFLFHPEG